jgi:hypothetical protein
MKRIPLVRFKSNLTKRIFDRHKCHQKMPGKLAQSGFQQLA